jgi:hypothetical protein
MISVVGTAAVELTGGQMRRLFGRATRLATTLRNPHGGRLRVIRELIERVIVDEKRVVVAIRRSALSDGEVPLRASMAVRSS